MRVVPNAAEVVAGNHFASYRKGWQAGAATRAMDPAFEDHPDEAITVAYNTGYRDGQLARDRAMRKAAKAYGHKISVMRLARSE